MPNLDAIADARNHAAADEHFADDDHSCCAKCLMPVSEYRGVWIDGVKYCSDCASVIAKEM